MGISHPWGGKGEAPVLEGRMTVRRRISRWIGHSAFAAAVFGGSVAVVLGGSVSACSDDDKATDGLPPLFDAGPADAARPDTGSDGSADGSRPDGTSDASDGAGDGGSNG
jgi:hypothetical protein